MCTQKMSIFISFIIIMLTSGCITGNIIEDENSIITRREGVVNPPGVFPIVNEPIVLRVATVADSYVQDYDTNEFTLYYQEKTNIYVDWEIVPKSDISAWAQSRLAGGSLPDVFLKCNLPDATVLYYGTNGTLIPLEELIDEYGPNTKRAMEESPYILDSMVTPGGSIYYIPTIGEVFHASMPKKAWINQVWLDALGLPLPKTTDELYNTLLAFKNQDPNGNGKADEIPFAGATELHNEIESFLLQSFLFYDQSNYLAMEDGQVIFSPWTQEYKDGIAYIRMLMMEGLISPASFTQDRIALKTLAEQDEPVLGCVTAMYWGHFTDLSGESQRHKDYTALPVLKGSSGETYGYDRGYGPTVGSEIGSFAISKACAAPEAALRWMDELYDQEVLLSWDIHPSMGVEGENWIRNPEGVVGLDGLPASYELITPFGTLQNSHWSQTTNSYSSYSYRMRGAVTDETEVRLFQATAERYKPFSVYGKQIPFVFLEENQSARLNDLKIGINAVVQTYLIRFTTGDLSLDEGWEQYIRALKYAGADEYISLIQQAVNRKEVE